MKRTTAPLLLALPLLVAIAPVNAEDLYVAHAKRLPARAFDRMLPNQPVQAWIDANLPAGHRAEWGARITDCGEATGGLADRERDMPLCAEVEIEEGDEPRGYLALFVATERQGLLSEGMGLYFGYLDHGGILHHFWQLGDLVSLPRE